MGAGVRRGTRTGILAPAPTPILFCCNDRQTASHPFTGSFFPTRIFKVPAGKRDFLERKFSGKLRACPGVRAGGPGCGRTGFLAPPPPQKSFFRDGCQTAPPLACEKNSPMRKFWGESPRVKKFWFYLGAPYSGGCFPTERDGPRAVPRTRAR